MQTNYERRFTKTFIENTWYERPAGGGPGSWRRLPYESTRETPLDTQIREWVESSNSIIVNPGQVGIHTQWHNDDMTLKSVTLGLTVLYVERINAPDGQGPQEGQDAGQVEPNPTARPKIDGGGSSPGAGAGANTSKPGDVTGATAPGPGSPAGGPRRATIPARVTPRPTVARVTANKPGATLGRSAEPDSYFAEHGTDADAGSAEPCAPTGEPQSRTVPEVPPGDNT